MDAVFIKDLSRLERHKTQIALLIDFMLQRHVRMLSVTKGVDSFDENTDIFFGVRELMKDLMRAILDNRSTAHRYHKRQIVADTFLMKNAQPKIIRKNVCNGQKTSQISITGAPLCFYTI